MGFTVCLGNGFVGIVFVWRHLGFKRSRNTCGFYCVPIGNGFVGIVFVGIVLYGGI